MESLSDNLYIIIDLEHARRRRSGINGHRKEDPPPGICAVRKLDEEMLIAAVHATIWWHKEPPTRQQSRRGSRLVAANLRRCDSTRQAIVSRLGLLMDARDPEEEDQNLMSAQEVSPKCDDRKGTLPQMLGEGGLPSNVDTFGQISCV
ncbi:unnamed protein product [Heterotrigona itama]|uniref:Uncharacterized protein n=1 Tax=Heterotrigona itama TaxID=395501 RepID=A0A6V7HK23_9HYME|nr:unnamed protein product [Heterotrigona itama]